MQPGRWRWNWITLPGIYVWLPTFPEKMPTLKSITELYCTSRDFRGHHCALYRNSIQCQPIELQY